MKKLKVIIVEDELPARERIFKLLKEFSDSISILDECTNYAEAIKMLSKTNYDLIFLDIQLKNRNAFEILKKVTLHDECNIVFTTAYDKYAVKAFESHAFDYLLKPFKDDRFKDTMERILKEVNKKSNPLYSNQEKLNSLLEYINLKKDDQALVHIPVKISNRVYFVKVDDINYISASGYYAELYVDKQKHLIRESLTNLIKNLPSDKFLRIHRSTIVNKDFIKELVSIGYGEYELKMNNGKLLKLSKSYKNYFLVNMGLRE